MKTAERFFKWCILLMGFLWSQIVWSLEMISLNQSSYTMINTSNLVLATPTENITLITDNFDQGVSQYFEFLKPTSGTPFWIGGKVYGSGVSGNASMNYESGRGMIARIEGTSLLVPRWATWNFLTWENYSVRVDYKKEGAGSSFFSLRYNEKPQFRHGYWIEDTGTQLILYRQDKHPYVADGAKFRKLLTYKSRPVTTGWNTLEMKVDSTTVSGYPAAQINVYLNTQLIISHLDSLFSTYIENGTSVQYGPVAFGGISFGTDGAYSKLSLDNISVTGSVHGSQTWHQTMGPEGGLAADIAISPNDPNTVYVGGFDGGLYRSKDGGINWKEIGLPNRMPKVRIRNVEVHPKNPNYIYVGTAAKHLSSFWRSENGGDSWFWTGAGNLDMDGETYAIALDPDDPKRLFIGLSDKCNKQGKRIDGVYSSTDGGVNLTRLTYGSGSGIGCQETYSANIAIAKDPVTGAVTQQMSDGGGLIGALAINPHNKLHLLAGTYFVPGGYHVWKSGSKALLSSLDGGKTWSAYSDGLTYNGSPEMVREIKFHPQIPGLIYLTTESSGRFYWRNYLNTQMTSWQLGSELLGNWLRGILFFPQSNAPSEVAVYGHRGILISANYGREKWSQHSAVIGIISAAVAPSDPSRVYANEGTVGMMHSFDGGKTFSVSNKGLKIHPIRSISIATNDTKRVYAASDNGIFRSVDGGESWSPTTLTGMFHSVAVDPQNDDVVYVGGGNWGADNWYMYRSHDGGFSWDELDVQNMAYPIGSILVHPKDSNLVFAGAAAGPQGRCDAGPTKSIHIEWSMANGTYTSDKDMKCWSTGLWVSTNAGKSFSKISSVPNRMVTDIKVSPSNTNVVVVSTQGGGVYLSADVGKTFKSINGTSTQGIQDTLDNGVSKGKMVWTLAVHPTSDKIFYAGVSSHYAKITNGLENTLYVTYDQGVTWIPVLKSNNNPSATPKTLQYKDYYMIGFGGGVDAIALDPKNPNRVFVALHDPGVVVTEDGGKNWRYANEGLMPTLAHVYPYRLSMSPDGSYLLSATCGRSIFKNRLTSADFQSTSIAYATAEVIPLYEFMEIMLNTSVTSDNVLQTYQYNLGLKE
ncbi:MAG: hypothetical protein HYV97_11950 [Bdellovibrio sp.]|nr:hypothetical protein [Bdellovibrio sp.]